MTAYFVYNLLTLRTIGFSGDPGVGWHLAGGEWIYAHLSIPQTDPFLSIARPWICDQWLSDLCFYLLAEFGGGVRSAAGLELLSAVLIVFFLVAYFGILARSITRANTSRIAEACAVLYAACAALMHCILRPVILSFFLFALTQLLITRQSRWRSTALVVIFIVWANAHPSFVLGLLLVWLHLHKSLIPWIITAATFLNPYIYKLHTSIAELGQSAYFMRLNSEWLPADSGSIEEAIFLLAIMLVATAEVLNRRVNLKTLSPPIEIVTLAVFALAFLQSIRFMPYFGLVAAAPLARSIDFISKRIGLYASAALRRCADRFNRFETERYLSLNFGCIAALLILVSAAIGGGIPLASQTFLPPESVYPYGSLEALKGRTGIVAAPPDWGGFITWRSEGRIRPILDDRNSLLGEAPYRAFFEAIRAVPALESYLEEERADYLVLPSRSRAATIARSSQQLRFIYGDAISSIFSK